MVAFSIRQLGVEDFASYRAIRLDALRDHPEAFASGYESASRRPDSDWREVLGRLAFFGAIAGDGRLVGIVAFERSDGDKDQHRGWMLQMYVRPELRGTGCAMALVEALLDHARGQVLQVHLGVGASNTAAIKLYQRAGFEIYGTDPRAFYVNGRFIDDHFMVRFLDKAPGKTNENE